MRQFMVRRGQNSAPIGFVPFTLDILHIVNCVTARKVSRAPFA